jgi:hypothetical protein
MHANTHPGFTAPQFQLISDWIRAQPQPYAELQLASPLNDEAATNELLQALDIQPDLGGEEISKLAVAVARILLRDVAASLPQWSTMRDEVLIVARDNAWVQDVLRPLGIIPAELFEINWADSGPGFSWPESYHACPVPGLDIIVVTASVDSPDMYGFTDWALGWFHCSENTVEASGHIIRAWWQYQVDSWDQQPWCYLFGTGLVSAGVAEDWRDGVWTEDADEDDSEADDLGELG